MSKEQAKMIRFDREGDCLIYRGVKGKTVENIRLSYGDEHTIYVTVAFTDHTEMAVSLDSIPVAAVSLYAESEEDGDLERIAHSGHILLPEAGYLRWNQIKQPPKN